MDIDHILYISWLLKQVMSLMQTISEAAVFF